MPRVGDEPLLLLDVFDHRLYGPVAEQRHQQPRQQYRPRARRAGDHRQPAHRLQPGLAVQEHGHPEPVLLALHDEHVAVQKAAGAPAVQGAAGDLGQLLGGVARLPGGVAQRVFAVGLHDHGEEPGRGEYAAELSAAVCHGLV